MDPRESPSAAAVAKSILGLPESAQTTEIKDQISQLVKSVGKNAPPSVNRETVRDFIQNWPESNEFKNLFRGIYEYVKNMNMQPYTMLDIPDTIEGRDTWTAVFRMLESFYNSLAGCH